MPHHVTSFAVLALADNCKLWNGNREMEKNLALPLADSYLTLVKINVQSHHSCEQSPEVQTKEDERPCLTNPWSRQAPFLLPSPYLHVISHARRIHPPCPGESPCQCGSCYPHPPENTSLLLSSDKGEQNQMVQQGQNLLLTGQWLGPAAMLQSPQILCIFPSSDLPTIEDRFANKLRNKKTSSQTFFNHPTAKDSHWMLDCTLGQ